MNCETAKAQVFPYVDEELAHDLRDEMVAHLSGCPSCQRLVEQELAFRDVYVAHLRPDPAPPRVREQVNRLLDRLGEGAAAPRRRPAYAGWMSLYAAAAVLLLALGVVAGMKVATFRQQGNLLAELAEASVDQHQKLVRGLLPPDITGVTPEAAEAWFRQRLDFNVRLPETQRKDLTLLGARISQLAGADVAALEYRLDGKQVSLFVISDEAYTRLGLSEKPKFKMLKLRGYDVIVWRHHGSGYALVSEIGGRSCLVCHSPDEKLDFPYESLV